MVRFRSPCSLDSYDLHRFFFQYWWSFCGGFRLEVRMYGSAAGHVGLRPDGGILVIYASGAGKGDVMSEREDQDDFSRRSGG